MHTSINQMLYPDRQAFFEKACIKFTGTTRDQDRTRANALRGAQTRLANYAEGRADAEAEHGATKHAGAPMITETSKLDSPRSRELLFHRISQDYLIKEAPQHFACEAVVFWVIMMAAAPPLLNATNAVLELIRLSGGA